MEEPVSKSQKKRDAAFVQKIGVELVALPVNKLQDLPLPDTLRQALMAAKTIKSHGAMRRQAQLIGKLMRSADTEVILAAYEDMMAEGNAATVSFHDLEQWRDRLIMEGKEALTEFISRHPGVDVQQLRQWIKKASDEKVSGKPAGAAKALFRFLRQTVK